MKQDFSNKSDEPHVLYHGTSANIQNGAIKPHWSKTHTGARQGMFTFASDNPLLAIAHAIKTRECINAGYMNDEIYLLVANIDDYLGPEQEKLNAIEASHVFELPVGQFELVEDHVYPYDEWVCKYPIDISNKPKHKIHSISTAMEKGLQIIYLKADELQANEYFLTKGIISPSSVASLIDKDRIGWLNSDIGIKPSIALQQAINDTITAKGSSPQSYNDFF